MEEKHLSVTTISVELGVALGSRNGGWEMPAVSACRIMGKSGERVFRTSDELHVAIA